jgi:hypothetical protein
VWYPIKLISVSGYNKGKEADSDDGMGVFSTKWVGLGLGLGLFFYLK